MRRLAWLLGSLIPVGVAAAEEAAPPAAFEVRTTVVPFEGAPTPGEPKALHGPVVLPLTALAAGAAKSETYTATLGGTTLSFVLSDDGVVASQAVGEAPGPLLSATGEPWLHPQTGRRLGTRWKVTGARAGGQDVTVTVARRLGSTSGSAQVEELGPQRGTAIPLEFYDQVVTSVAKPADLGLGAFHGVFVRGTRVVAVSAVAGEGDALTAAIDLDCDNDLAEPQERLEAKGDPMMQAAGETMLRSGTRWTFPNLAVGDARVTVKIERTDPAVTATVAGTAGRRGKVEVEPRPHVLLLVDGDLDGGFVGKADLWWFGPADRMPSGRGTYANMFEGDELAYGEDGAWRLASVSPEGVARVERVASPPPVADYLARRAERVNRTRWFPMFRAEASDFARARAFDLSAPKAEKEPTWHFALASKDALAFAKAEGKPLLVDFEADWCVWCKRLDFYTYPDKDVAERLERFTLVKMNTELVRDDAWKAHYTKGLPALVVFDAEGKAVRFVGEKGETDTVPGWSRPEELAKTLDTLHRAATAAKSAPSK